MAGGLAIGVARATPGEPETFQAAAALRGLDYLITAREEPGGGWRISRMIWNNGTVPAEAGGEAS